MWAEEFEDNLASHRELLNVLEQGQGSGVRWIEGRADWKQDEQLASCGLLLDEE